MKNYLKGNILFRGVTPQKKHLKVKIRTTSGPACPQDMEVVGMYCGGPVKGDLVLTIYGAEIGEELPSNAYDISDGKTPPGHLYRFRAQLEECKWTLAAITEDEGVQTKVYQCDIKADVQWTEIEEDDEPTADCLWMIKAMLKRTHVNCAIFSEPLQVELDLDGEAEKSEAAAM